MHIQSALTLPPKELLPPLSRALYKSPSRTIRPFALIKSFSQGALSSTARDRFKFYC